jgi:cysteine-rich repeat protein
MTHAPRFLLALSLALVACSEGTPSAFQPPNDAGVPTLPRKDASSAVVVAECDQATDGTPCGDTAGSHCVFGLCLANQCGDGVVAGDEQCDDGNDRDGDGCPADCKEVTVCRDGELDPGEECDDGNRVNDDACSNSCLANECGNGRLDYGEECDDGNTRNGDACDATCGVVACGNGRLELGEACDGIAGCPSGQSCNDECSGCEGDPCQDCVVAKCSDYQGIPLYQGCYLAPDPAYAERPMVRFTEKCVALDECIRRNLNCYDPDRTHACFCGTNSAGDLLTPDQCVAATAVNGPCAEFYPAATGCETAEKVPECVLDFATDFSKPVGWSYFLSQCRYEECKAECGYL